MLDKYGGSFEELSGQERRNNLTQNHTQEGWATPPKQEETYFSFCFITFAYCFLMLALHTTQLLIVLDKLKGETSDVDEVEFT